MFERFFYIAHLLLFATCSVIYAVMNKPTISSYVFDGYLLILLGYVILVSGFSYSRRSVLILTLGFLYLVVQAILYFHDNYYSDTYAFLRASRYIVYFIIFVLMGDLLRASGPKCSLTKPRKLTEVLVFVFLAVYLFQGLVLGQTRPTLYSENNYEVPALLLLVAIFLYGGVAQIGGKKFVILAFFVSVLSKSKSGVLEGIILLFRFFVRTFNAKSIGVAMALFFVSVPVAWVIFADRMQGMGLLELDRFKFLQAFWDAMLDASLTEVILGHGLARVLPYNTCLELQFWASGISSDFAYCDSAVFHSFFMKLIYDTGIVGAVIFVYGWFYFLRDYLGQKTALTVFMIVSVCSLSVSGFSNSIVVWPLFLALFYQRNNSETIGQAPTKNNRTGTTIGQAPIKISHAN